MGGHGGGFDERALLESEMVGERHDALLGRNEEVLCTARSLEATDLECVADIVVATFAGIAFSADLLGRGGGLHARLHLRDAGSDRFDHGGEFVSLNHRIRRVGMLPVPDMDVGSTDTDFFDAEENFAGAGDGFWGCPELDVSGFGHGGLSHGVISFRSSSVCLRPRPTSHCPTR